MTPDEEEQQLRVTLMAVQIDKTRLDIDRVRQEIRMESRKFFLQALIATAAVFGAGVAVGHFLLHG
jgi:hypothetical protein